jgi:MFS family permease
MTNARRWAIVALLFTASLINYFDRQTLAFALPLISKELHLGPEAKGVLLSAFFWSYALMQIPMGILADRVNLRSLYAAAFTLWSIAQGLMGFAEGLGTLILFRVLLGIGEAIYLPGGSKIVSLLFKPAERGLPSGLFDAGTRTGLVVEGYVVPAMLLYYGWRYSFTIVGFAALVWLLPWFLIAPSNLRSPRSADQPPPAGFLNALTTLVGNRNLLGVCLTFFCFDYYWYFLVNWLPDYLVTVRGLTIVKAGIYAALPYFVFGASEPIGGWIADRLIASRGWTETQARKWVVTVAFLTGLCLIPAARVTGPTHALALIIGGCLVGLSTGNLLVVLQGCAPRDQIGLWTGVYNFVGNIAGILSPLMTGFLIAETGSYAPAFLLAAALIAVGPLALWFITGELGMSGDDSSSTKHTAVTPRTPSTTTR